MSVPRGLAVAATAFPEVGHVARPRNRRRCLHFLGRRRRLAGTVAAVAAVAVTALVSAPSASHGSAPHGVRAPGSGARLPVAAAGLLSRALGRGDASYWARRTAGGLVVVNRAQRLRARFDRGGVLVSSRGVSLGLRLRAFGYGSVLERLPAVAPRADADRVFYAHAGVSEWYANGPLGLEQGFTVPASPGRHAGPLTLALAVSGDVRGRTSGGAGGVLFTGAGGSLAYRGLAATDARGRALRAWVQLRGSDLLLRVAAAGARYPVRVDPFVQQAKLTSSDGAEFDFFGDSVAVSGRTLAVGVPDATIGSNFEQGAVYVFVRPASGWTDATQTAKLTASDGAANDLFGQSVAVSGDTIVAGAPHATVGGDTDRGAVYVFVRPASGWVDGTQTAKLTASDGATFDNFGSSVGVSGHTIVAGAPAATVNTNFLEGAVYVFVRPASGWADATQTAKLTGAGGIPGDSLGQSVAIDGDTIAAGAPQTTVTEFPGPEAVDVFVKPASGWVNATSTAKLTASDGVLTDNFGISVAISGNTVVAGAPDALVGFTPQQGVAYVFVKPASGWADATQTAKLTASDGTSGDSFGLSVAVTGNTAVVGANLATVGANFAQGAAYVFVKPASGWADGTQTAKLTAPDGAAGDRLGTSVAVSGHTAVAGAPGAPVGGNPLQGAAYVFRAERHP
jgi:trimeric autotransporter adhesin